MSYNCNHFLWQTNKNAHNCIVLQNNLKINLVVLPIGEIVKDLAFSLRECGISFIWIQLEF